MTPEEKEVYISLIVFGGIIAAGSVIIIGLGMLLLGIYNRKTKQKVTKELYEQKERENGQSKGGARAHW